MRQSSSIRGGGCFCLFGSLDFDVERISDYPLPSGDIGLKACGPELTKSCLMRSSHIQIVTLVFILALVAMFLLYFFKVVDMFW